jgi:hypothetical protein
MTDSWIDIAHQLREENDRLRAENARMKAMPEASEAVRAVVYGEEIDKLRAEVESWQEAFGLLTTLHGKMEINVSDPMGMAQAIERHVRAEVEALKKQILLAQMAIDGEGPRTCYEGSDDEVGVHGCCGEVSYRPHGPGCWWVELQAALAAGEGGNQP